MLPTALYSANILVAAPPSLQRQGLLSTLQDKWPLLSCSVTADTSQLPMLVRQQAYALIVLDSTLSGLPVGELIRQIRSIRSCQPLLVLTGPRLTPVQRQQLLLAGTVSLLPHTVAPTALLTTIAPFVSGAMHWTLPPSITPTRVAPPTPFSNREVEVLRLVVADYCNQEIADKLCLSVRTVESHRRTLLQKTGAKTLVGLVVQAVREGWVGVA